MQRKLRKPQLYPDKLKSFSFNYIEVSINNKNNISIVISITEKSSKVYKSYCLQNKSVLPQYLSVMFAARLYNLLNHIYKVFSSMLFIERNIRVCTRIESLNLYLIKKI